MSRGELVMSHNTRLGTCSSCPGWSVTAGLVIIQPASLCSTLAKGPAVSVSRECRRVGSCFDCTVVRGGEGCAMVGFVFVSCCMIVCFFCCFGWCLSFVGFESRVRSA